MRNQPETSRARSLPVLSVTLNGPTRWMVHAIQHLAHQTDSPVKWDFPHRRAFIRKCSRAQGIRCRRLANG